MAISPTLSTVEVIPATGGNEPNGTAIAYLRVTVRDTLGALLTTRAQVHVTSINDPGGQFLIDHDHEDPARPQFDTTYTDLATGQALIDLRSTLEGTARYLVEMGEDDGQIGYTENAQQGKPERDFPVGPILQYTREFLTPQTIDDAWLLANNTFGGVTSTTIRNTLFRDTVTVAKNAIGFANCTFAVLASVDHCLVTDNHVFAVQSCAFRGSGVAAIQGEGGVYTRCVVYQTGGHAVAIEQSGTTVSAPPDDFTESKFLSCLFRLIGIVSGGSALSGTPARNVRFDHCWFDMGDSDDPVIHQVTEAAGARGPFLIGCWIDSGADVPIVVETGASNVRQQFLALRACRFGVDPGDTYIANEGEFPIAQSNLAPDGEPIDNATHLGANITAGLLWAWPRTTYTASVPEVEWTTTTGGGGTGGPPGGNGVPGTGGGSMPGLGVDFLYTLREVQGQPLGGGGTGNVIRATRINDVPIAATPILLGGTTGPPPLSPHTVQWLTPNSTVAEGNSVTIYAELRNSAGQTPSQAALAGYSVPLTVTYVAVGAAVAGEEADYTIPADLVFAPGAALGSIVVEAVNDNSTEPLENARIALGQVVGDVGGQQVVVVVPSSTAANHDCMIEASDPVSPAVTVFWGGVSDAINEGSASNTTYQIPLRISGNPSQPVSVQIDFTGTAQYVGSGTPPADYAIVTPTVPGTPSRCIVTFQPTSGATPADINIVLSIIGDTSFEPAETIIATLTVLEVATVAVAGTTSVFTLTLNNDDADPGNPPQLYWFEQAVTLYEALGTSQPSSRAVEIRATNLATSFAANTTVNVEVIDTITAPGGGYGIDYEIQFDPPNAGNFGQVPFAANTNRRSILLLGQPDFDSDDGEQFIIRLLPDTASPARYTVDTTRDTLTVTLRDALGTEAEVLCPRIQGVAASLVHATVALTDTVTTATGISMAGYTCQWHPVAYNPDGTPDTVHIWGLVDGSTASVPGQTGAITVQGGALGNPTIPINVATQFATVTGSGLALTLVHNVNGETRDFTMSLATATAIIDTGTAGLQGGGPRLFARYRRADALRASPGTSIANDFCTAARVYLDCRADINAVRLAINWGNYRWNKPADAGQYTANDYVNGEVYFDELVLEGIPAGWAAVVLDPRTTVSAFSGSSCTIIAARGGTARNYVPPYRGHIAYVVLYETATVTAATARGVLYGFDSGIVVGGIGLDQNDALGELGTPILNYGEGSILFENRNQGGVYAVGSGWSASDYFSERARDRALSAINTGLSETGSGEAVARGWWHGAGLADGGAPSGDRVAISGGVCPGIRHQQYVMLELVHLWQRVGGVTWTSRAEMSTDEDFCTGTAGAGFKMATAMGRNIGGQRMGHQHFYVPDYRETGLGVGSGVKLGPGRKRAAGSIVIAAIPADGDEFTLPDGVNTARTFRFGTGTDTGTLKHVAIGSSTYATTSNLLAAINAAINPTTFTVVPWRAGDTRIEVANRFSGTVGNVSMTSTVPAVVVVTGMAGGLSTNANGIRLWNYLVPGANTCAFDVDTAWHIKAIDAERAYHTWDWPHMSRMNEAVRDGWWLYLDPIAYDIATDLMHLATQCMQRYPEDRSSIFLSQPTGVNQIYSAFNYANWAGANEGHAGRYLMWYVLNDHTGAYPSSLLSGAVNSNQGLKCGRWLTRNVTVASSAFNPATAPGSSFAPTGDWQVDRGIGWILCILARGYAIDPAHRPTATMNDQLTRLHQGGAAWNALRPSWFESARQALDLTAHVSGAASSQDISATASLYLLSGHPPDFTTRMGSIPGGTQNDSVPATFDEEWYANVITWHNNFVAMGCYAVLRRVYAKVNRSTLPTSNAWLTSTQRILGFIKLALIAAKAKMGGTQFYVPRFHVVGVGDPNTAGTAGSIGVHGRFNSEIGAANPLVTFRRGLANTTGDVWWWSETVPADGNFQQNYYYIQYMMGVWMLKRATGDLEALDIMPGLSGNGPSPLVVASAGVVDHIMNRWLQYTNTSPWEGTGDEVAWCVQWLRNEHGAP